MAAKKKLGSAGRFTTRYSTRIRNKVSEIEKKERTKYECPSCNRFAVRREFKGVWKCGKCTHTFTSKAYSIGE